MVLVLLAGVLALRGFHKDVPRAYNATEVTRSAQAWTGPRRDALKQQQRARHDAARAACAKHDSSVVRANTDAKSFQETGGWCLPEGRNASSRVALRRRTVPRRTPLRRVEGGLAILVHDCATAQRTHKVIKLQ